jgi:pimeloyl-ACP methyl ester carboxylesterase
MRLVQTLVLKYTRTKFKLLSSISKRKAAGKAFVLFCTPQHRNRKPLPPVFQDAEQLEFGFKGYTIRGYRWNHDAQSNKRAQILHGFESSVVNFDRFIKPLLKKGYEVIAFDAPAHGRSSGRMINVLTYKEMILFVYRNFGPVTSYIAHSFGGLSLALALEEIDHDANTSVVLIAPAAETTTAIDNFFHLLQLDKGVREEFDQVIRSIEGKGPEWYSINRASAAIKASVLFLQDKDDHMTPLKDVVPIQKKNLPNFRFIITEGLGHRRIYRDARVSKEVIEFL